MQILTQMKQLALKDKKEFDKTYSSLNFPLAEHSFAWLRLWRNDYRDMQWTRINGNTCLFLTFEKKRSLWNPVFSREFPDTTQECFRMLKEQGHSPAAMYIPEEHKEQFESIPGCRLIEQNQDYLYKTEDIISLKGRKYRDKRNKRNFFINNYNYRAEEYNPENHRQGCMQLLEQWTKEKSAGVNGEGLEKLKADAMANTMALQEAGALGVKGMVVLVNGKAEGYIFGEQPNKNVCTMFLGKTNQSIKGLSQFTYGEFLRRFFPGTRYVNDGEDWGVSYLQHSKESYKPAMKRKSYTLVQDA